MSDGSHDHYELQTCPACENDEPLHVWRAMIKCEKYSEPLFVGFHLECPVCDYNTLVLLFVDAFDEGLYMVYGTSKTGVKWPIPSEYAQDIADNIVYVV